MNAPAPKPAPTPAPSAPTHAAATERAVGLATTLAPIITGIGAPFLDGGAAFTATLAYGAAGGFLAANYMNRLPNAVLAQIPGADIVRAHRSTLFTATLTSGMALAVGTLGGPAGTDALMAGILDMPSIPGILSLGWWAGVALVPFKLRTVLRRPRRPKTVPPQAPASTYTAPKPALVPFTTADDIYMRWARHISDPATGKHKQQELTLRTVTNDKWTGTITAAAGASVNVTAETISSVYQVPAERVHLRDGAHAGERHVTVHRTAPPALDTTTLAGAWAKWVATTVMKGSHLEDIQHDPATGGEVAIVVADDDKPRLVTPDRDDLVGALRTNTLLCSYTPTPGDPRRGVVRLMKHNPLQEGTPFPGTHVLEISDGGYVQIGRHISGFPARVQFTDPVLGAKHLFIAGVTGSGKGGLVQIIALADHVNGFAIIYGDPKGSSNPDIELMACYSGLGDDGIMGALRVAYALLKWRIAESARLKMKNFVATPGRPWVRVIIDEAHVPLTELVDTNKEAQIIVEALAAKARSLGITLLIVNQAVNADKLGGSTTLRTNVIQGGSLVMLRSDSGQSHLVTTGFEGIDPGQIPASWDVDRPLIYDETVAMKDPKATFGLGYTLGPGGAAEMMRTFILESAAPYVDTDAVAYPADWPDWDRRHEIAATPVVDDGQDGGSASSMGTRIGGLLPSVWDTAPKKPTTADEKILAAFADLDDPIGLETVYVDKDRITAATGVDGQTLNNALTRLTKKGKLHRQVEDGKEIRGVYGLGPEPRTTATPAPGADTAATDDEDESISREVNELLPVAIDLVVTTQHASRAMLQRKLRTGWQTTKALLDVMEQAGIVTAPGAGGHRDVLADPADYAENLDQAQRGRTAE
ncbi:DNA translocase FtsK [Streptomyces sp. NPDC056069]|uniref:DNA translocase FtsK n=1 Tax=Streptomyces sp. NPDC056069 TaxID=3345702 RepID=UPI0035E11E37